MFVYLTAPPLVWNCLQYEFIEKNIDFEEGYFVIFESWVTITGFIIKEMKGYHLS